MSMRFVGKSLAFALGFSFAFLPSFGPFISLLFFFESRRSIFRSVWLWIAATLLLALPLLPNLPQFSMGLLQIIAPWLIYTAARQLPQLRSYPMHSRSLAYGLVSGLAMVVTLGLFNISQVTFAYKTLSQVISWHSYPALYGHTVLTLGALIAILSPKGRFRLIGLGLSALGILLSGSREAALAWVFIVTTLLFHETRSWRTRILELGFSLAMILISMGLGSYIGWGNMGFLLDIVPTQSKNLFQGSEIANGDWWDTTWVEIEGSKTTLSNQEVSVYSVLKKQSDQWLRLQQVIPLKTGSVYTLSVWLRTDENTIPGLQGWGKLNDTQAFVLDGEWRNDTWRATTSGEGQVLDSGILAAEGPWRRVFVTFRYQGERPTLYWYVGFTPDQQESYRTRSSFAGLQLKEGPTPTDYIPGAATRGLSLGVARLPYWQVALQGIKEKPLLGWGQASFPQYYQTHNDAQGQLRETPAHVHNLYLHILFERGLIGFLGLLLFIISLSIKAIQRRDIPFLIVFAGILLINFFDVSLIYGGVLYPLAAIAGWRSQVYTPTQTDMRAKEFLVRFTLAMIDIILVYVALLISRKIYFWFGGTLPTMSQTLFYSLILWPILCWREGLYPGYGLIPPQELRKHVMSCFYAGIILTAGTVLFSDLHMPREVLLGMIVLSILLLPLGRGFSKRLLRTIGLWGKPVAILGAGEIGRRVVQTLVKNPLQGLQPVAIFDDDIHKQHSIISGIPVLGNLSEAQQYAHERILDHAIIALPSMPAHLLTDLVNQHSHSFRVVQFVPDLVSLRSEDVSTSNLAGLLALQVKNALAIPSNQIIKRLLDVASIVLGGLLISPVFILLALIIYLDSPGPIFFGHSRIGREGKSFKAWKFRTMVPNAQVMLKDYLELNPELRAEWESSQKLKNDPRITRIGKFLRKYSLDELPQLWNVLVGDMSLVGPRPIVESEIIKYKEVFELYKMVRPGLTGYWQVSGRSDTDYDYRVFLDSYYVKNWSVWLDIIILAQTPITVLKGEGSY